MANIKVNDIKSASANIKPAGAELFGDSESFINDLEDNEFELAGGLPHCPNCNTRWWQCNTRTNRTLLCTCDRDCNPWIAFA